jgi:hypothetical protein
MRSSTKWWTAGFGQCLGQGSACTCGVTAGMGTTWEKEPGAWAQAQRGMETDRWAPHLRFFPGLKLKANSVPGSS